MQDCKSFCDLFYAICNSVGRQLGTGHSEAIYQKACGQYLQSFGVSHQLEQHVPVILHTNDMYIYRVASNVCASPTTVFHIGDERIDILAYDDFDNVHIIELKAIGARVSPAKPTPKSILNASHVQLLKYVRLLAQDDRYKKQLVTGYVVNFRQHALLEDPFSITVEFDVYDVAQQRWVFGYLPNSATTSPEASDERSEPRNVIALDKR